MYVAYQNINFINDDIYGHTTTPLHSTPGLFRTRVSRESIYELRFSLENERGVPPLLGGQSSVEYITHTVAAVFIQYLSELPEPLLGFDSHIGICACENIEDDEPRARNLSLLVQEAPWYNQPLLSKVSIHVYNPNCILVFTLSPCNDLPLPNSEMIYLRSCPYS